VIVKRLDDGTIAGEYGPDDPTLKSFDVGSWPTYQKVATTRATRMTGPFTVETSEGPLRCEDGYLAMDARGYPYPIATDEFELIYRPVDPDEPVVPEPAPFMKRLGAIEAHPATLAVLRFFAYDHLPAELQAISKPFGDLALDVAAGAQGAEATIAIRKLLEAKDAAVRDALPPAPAYPLVQSAQQGPS
jgi:hypothetical protein